MTLNQFVHTKPVFRFVDEYACGWQDGGCYMLAQAIAFWLGGRLACLYREEFADEQTADHYVVRFGDFYIDSNGVSTSEDLLSHWNRFVLKNGVTHLEDPADPCRAVTMLQHYHSSIGIAEQLRTQFGQPSVKNVGEVLGYADIEVAALQ